MGIVGAGLTLARLIASSEANSLRVSSSSSIPMLRACPNPAIPDVPFCSQVDKNIGPAGLAIRRVSASPHYFSSFDPPRLCCKARRFPYMHVTNKTVTNSAKVVTVNHSKGKSGKC
jgi:hypothetical protein